MRKKVLGVAALLLCSIPAIVFAGSVYVPLAVDETIDGVRYRTQVWVTNDDTAEDQVTTYFIPTDTDGTDRPGEWGTQTSVLPGTSKLLSSVAPAGTTGILEISGSPEMVVTAQMVATVDGEEPLGTPLRVISSQNAFVPGSVSHLQGWIRSPDLRSDYGIVNLGHQPASCSIKVVRRGGLQILSTAVVTVQALSQRHFGDALDILGEPAIAAVRSETSCDQPFSTYLRTYDRATGELFFVQPSAKLADSTFVPPGTQPPPPECPAGATCYDFLSTPFQPTPGAPTRGIDMNLPSGQYSRINLEMDVFHGGWQNPSSGLHNIIWFAKDRNRNLYGYINFLGPNKNEVMLRHGIGVPQGQKAKILRALVAQPGTTYHFDYVYDTAAQRIELIVSQGGQELVRIVDTPNVNNINVSPGERFRAGLGFEPGANPNEPPTYGWRYSNLRVQFIP